MINEVKVYSRYHIENFVRNGGLNFPYTNRPWYLISIYSEDMDIFLTKYNKKAIKDMGCKQALSLKFWDITDKQAKEFKSKDLYDNAVLFNIQQAELIIGFILSSNQDDESDGVLVIHCDAGISRSGACGTFAVDFLNLDYESFIKKNNYLMPNPYILRVLRKTARMTPQFLEKVEKRDIEKVKKDNFLLKEKIDNGELF